MRKALVCAAVAALACALLLAGCAGKGSLSSDFDDQTGAYKVTADDAGKDSAVAASGGVMIEEGQVLLLDSDLSKGSLQVRILDASGEVVFDERISGRLLSSYGLEYGEYTIGVTCKENGTTGTLFVKAVDPSEVPK